MNAKKLHEPGRGWGRTKMLHDTSQEKLAVPGGYKMVRLNTASTAGLKDLASYRRDFELARSFSKLYLSDDEDGDEDNDDEGEGVEDEAEDGEDEESTTQSVAMWVAAVTQYARGFGNGVRHQERPNQGLFNPEQLAQHQFFIDLRNKYVAHSVNGFERVEVFAWITSSSFAPRRVSDVGQVHMGVQGMTEDRARQLITLCEIQIRDYNRRIKAAHRTLWTEVYALGLEAVYQLPEVDPFVIDDERVAHSRAGGKRT